MLALGAEVVAAGPERRAAHPHRLLLHRAVRDGASRPTRSSPRSAIPRPPPRSGGAYLKLERKVGDFATAAVAAQVTLAADGTCAQVGIGLTNVGLTPIKADAGGGRAARARGRTRRPSSRRRSSPPTPPDPAADLRGSVEYKKDMVRVLTARALRKALERAGGGR